MRNEQPFCPLLYKAICVGQLPPLPGGQGVGGAGGRDIKYGRGVISPGEIQTFQKDEGLCVCVCVCVVCV